MNLKQIPVLNAQLENILQLMPLLVLTVQDLELQQAAAVPAHVPVHVLAVMQVPEVALISPALPAELVNTTQEQQHVRVA